ncbi:MAG: HAMP domain-containing histidine kinase [Eggerthellaceae bacterium]|nr:HAMP domain-containing histidine kinase [Eggerthellaceae bacterium]
MRRLYLRFALALFSAVMLAFFLGTLLSLLFVGGGAQSSEGSITESFLLVMRARALLITALTVVICGLVIVLTAKKTVAPIVALSGAARQIRAGNLEIPIQASERKDEIGELERDFCLMVAELKSNEFMRKDFIANISHEFKTPLSIIEGYAQLLAEAELTDEERVAYAQIIRKESERLHSLSTKILRLSRLETQAIAAKRGSFQLDEQLRQAVLLLEPKWSRRGIGFDVALAEQQFCGDEELLSEVWLNLIENAVKFSYDGGQIRVRLGVDAGGQAVEVEVADDGPGMDAETKARAFEQFYQGESSRSTEGNGLGLAIVKRIVDLHGGEVGIDSAPGCGTRVLVRLPL